LQSLSSIKSEADRARRETTDPGTKRLAEAVVELCKVVENLRGIADDALSTAKKNRLK